MLGQRPRRWANINAVLGVMMSRVLGTGPLPSKHKTFVYYLYNVGPASKTLGRRCINVIQQICVCCGPVTTYLHGKMLYTCMYILISLFGYGRVYLSLQTVADTPFHVQGYDNGPIMDIILCPLSMDMLP